MPGRALDLSLPRSVARQSEAGFADQPTSVALLRVYGERMVPHSGAVIHKPSGQAVFAVNGSAEVEDGRRVLICNVSGSSRLQRGGLYVRDHRSKRRSLTAPVIDLPGVPCEQTCGEADGA